MFPFDAMGAAASATTAAAPTVADAAAAAAPVIADAAEDAAAQLSAAAQSALSTVGPALENLTRDFDGTAAAGALAVGAAFATVVKVVPTPLDLCFGPIGFAVSGVVDAAARACANREACATLSVAAMTAARTLLESIALVKADDLARGDGLRARLEPPLVRMRGTLERAQVRRAQRLARARGPVARSFGPI